MMGITATDTDVALVGFQPPGRGVKPQHVVQDKYFSLRTFVCGDAPLPEWWACQWSPG